MKIYFAPLEGITRYIFRNAYEKYYGGIEKYFAPFISPTDNCFLTPKNVRELCPEHNQGIRLVPQILTNNSVAFIGACSELKCMGYKEFNLNLGCPSGTVCAKKKGAGFLTEWYEMEQLFDAIYDWAGANDVEISIKTRLGRFAPEEFYDILEIYNKYPISELIIHPRIEKDYYKGEPRMEFYDYAVEHSVNSVIFNGNLFSANQIKEHITKYQRNASHTPDIIMLGRGLLYNPELSSVDSENEFDYKRFWDFHDEIYHGYQEIMSPDKNVLFHMKELWTYWKELFREDERVIKSILKSRDFGEYEASLMAIRY